MCPEPSDKPNQPRLLWPSVNADFIMQFTKFFIAGGAAAAIIIWLNFRHF